jgi:hypothetical protein
LNKHQNAQYTESEFVGLNRRDAGACIPSGLSPKKPCVRSSVEVKPDHSGVQVS